MQALIEIIYKDKINKIQEKTFKQAYLKTIYFNYYISNKIRVSLVSNFFYLEPIYDHTVAY